MPVQLVEFKAVYTCTLISNVFALHAKLYSIITKVDVFVPLHADTVLGAALRTIN